MSSYPGVRIHRSATVVAKVVPPLFVGDYGIASPTFSWIILIFSPDG